MKAVLLSIRPKWCELIARGEKTLEVRKTRPKLKTPFKCYIYCTAKYDRRRDGYFQGQCCGKVIGEFLCDRIETIDCDSRAYEKHSADACMSKDDFIGYCNGQALYGWHITDLKIYDIPRALSNYRRCRKCGSDNGCEHCDGLRDVEKPPQSWCYIATGGSCYDM